MDPKEKFREILREGALRFSAEEIPLSIERPANPEHGDYASNIALQLSKRLRRNPRQIAEEIAKASARVTREFYVNDAGRQMEILALSVWLRYLQMRNMDVPFPEEAYRGDYVRDIAARLANENLARKADFSGVLPDADAEIDRLIDPAKMTLGEGWKRVHQWALEAMLADQREDLAAFRVSFDHWSSEQALHDQGLIDHALSLF